MVLVFLPTLASFLSNTLSLSDEKAISEGIIIPRPPAFPGEMLMAGGQHADTYDRSSFEEDT
jgi:hypothetical protein